MQISITKLHGLGNSFLLVDNRTPMAIDYIELAKEMCDYRFGIGADGLILVDNPSKMTSNTTAPQNDFRMRIFNSDGSEPEMCGNGIRCFAYYLKYKSISLKPTHNIETLAGTIRTKLSHENDDIAQIEVDMGEPAFQSNDLAKGLDPLAIKIENRTYSFVSMGNPHVITFVDNFEFDYLSEGKKVENDTTRFPNRTNVEFIRKISDSELEMRVWERGCGETLACGTGTCASVVAAVRNNIIPRQLVTVHLLGGDLKIEWSQETNHIFMTGPAQIVLDGTYHTKLK